MADRDRVSDVKFVINEEEIAIVPNTVEFPLGGPGRYVYINMKYKDPEDGLMYRLFGTVRRVEVTARNEDGIKTVE